MMFTAFVEDEYGDTVIRYDDCMKIAVYPERDMELLFPDIYEAIGICSSYVQLVNSSGNHFYPLHIYSVKIG